MRDPTDKKTPDMLNENMTKAQRYRAKQLALGFRQYAYWLTEVEEPRVRMYIAKLRKGKTWTGT
jgi:hypothetical protein